MNQFKSGWFKFLGPCGRAPFTGAFWKLPVGDRPGEWMPRVDNIKLCERGYHVTDSLNAPHWIQSNLYEVEVNGNGHGTFGKYVFPEARLIRQLDWNNDKIAHLGIDCIVWILPIYDHYLPYSRIKPSVCPREILRLRRDYADAEARKSRKSAQLLAKLVDLSDRLFSEIYAPPRVRPTFCDDVVRSMMYSCAYWEPLYIGSCLDYANRVAMNDEPSRDFKKWAAERLWAYVDNMAVPLEIN